MTPDATETTVTPPVEATVAMPVVAETETLESLPSSDWRHDTITSFPAIRDDIPAPEAPAGDAPEPQACPCGSGKTLARCDGQVAPAEPGKGALLSCAPGVTSRMWRTRVANGQWGNLPALADLAHARVMMPALDRQRAIRGELAARRHDIRAVLTQNPSLRSDRVLGDGLRDMAARLEAGLAAMLADPAEHHGSGEDEAAAA